MEENEQSPLAAVEKRLVELEETIARETERLEDLKQEADGQSARVHERPGDDAAQAQLRETEHEVARLRKFLRVMDTERKELRARANTYRLQEQNARDRELRDQIKAWRARQKQLKSRLIPEAELALERLEEELKEIEEKITKAGEDLRSS